MKKDFLGFVHFGITVSDIHKTAEFFRDMLGFEIGDYREKVDLEEYGQMIGMENCLLKIVNVQRFDIVIELVQYVKPKGNIVDLSTNNTGTAHIAFQVQNIHKLYDEFSNKGLKFMWKEPVFIKSGIDKDCYAIYMKEFDGFTLEFYQAPEA
jgi:catechol 2,3-dioxygenase-like lactoylglutathione lyase family enzyme